MSAWIKLYKLMKNDLYSFVVPNILEYIGINEIKVMIFTQRNDWQFGLVRHGKSSWSFFIYNPKRLFDIILDCDLVELRTEYPIIAEMLSILMEAEI